MDDNAYSDKEYWSLSAALLEFQDATLRRFSTGLNAAEIKTAVLNLETARKAVYKAAIPYGKTRAAPEPSEAEIQAIAEAYCERKNISDYRLTPQDVYEAHKDGQRAALAALRAAKETDTTA
ncbi:MAG: hypothetical protein INH37_13680 [Myxococcaceae bacterium]|nr:hypothetical protein [Myxococcaceae bacterium]